MSMQLRAGTANRRPPAAHAAGPAVRDRALAGPERQAVHPDRERHQAVRRRLRGRQRLARHLPARVLRPAGPLRLRQDHASADARRLRDADRRPDPDRRPGHGGGAALEAAGQHDVPVLRAVPAHVGRGQHRLRPASRTACRRPRSATGSPRPCGWCSSTAARSAAPTSSPAARSSAWRWPARSSSARRCCCSTSRWVPWTRSCASRRSSSWSTSRKASA